MADTREDTAALEKNMRGKQLKTPAHPLPQTASRSPLPSDEATPRTAYGVVIDASVQYLKDTGWKETGCDNRNLPMWNDPTVADAKSRVEHRTLADKDRDGDQIVIKQLVVPVTAWDYRLEEAVQIQRDRDRVKAEAN